MAFRTVYRQTVEKQGSFVRNFMLDPLTDWCLTPHERRVKQNQNTIKQFLTEKLEKHAKWRKKNPITGEQPILMADAIKADDKFFDDDAAKLEHLVGAFYYLSLTTASAVCQLFYRAMTH